jgi:hypothetical protein
MRPFHPITLVRRAGLALAFLLALATTPLAAQDFRMDTDVFIGSSKEPVAETLTLFSNARVYDFMLNEPREIVVFDHGRGEFTLLDEKQQIKTVVTTEQAIHHAHAIKVQSLEIPNSLFAEAADPKFKETFEERSENNQELTYVKLAGTTITYEAIGLRPKFPGAVQTYKEFATWCARLNCMRVGNLPPEARISLNRALAEKGLLPKEITRTVVLNEGLAKKTSEVRSRHLVNWTLSSEDQKRIDRAHDAMVKFTAVDFKEYQRRQSELLKTAAK